MKRIAFITDLHLDELFPLENKVNPYKNFETILVDITHREIDSVIFGGDIGEVTAHQYFFENLKKFSLDLILGNHDTLGSVKKYFAKGNDTKSLYYQFEDEKYQYFFLDTSVETLSTRQLIWLKNNLKNNKKLLLFIHHPILEIETYADKVYSLKNREELKSILLDFENDVTIFCGHYHVNDEREHENIKQYTTQSMSFQLIKNESKIEIDNVNFGYRIIEISEDVIKTELINFKS
jgi:3',5'-cyclic-AMP phosphodiesterase